MTLKEIEASTRIGVPLSPADTNAYVKTPQNIVVKLPWIDDVASGGRPYIFQKHLAPFHRPLKTQDWMDVREFPSSCHTKLLMAS
ncbi:hypothetical protein ACTXT7_014352 [Hymenolepis weldensis]